MYFFKLFISIVLVVLDVAELLSHGVLAGFNVDESKF